jgi:hypothetical protein
MVSPEYLEHNPSERSYKVMVLILPAIRVIVANDDPWQKRESTQRSDNLRWFRAALRSTRHGYAPMTVKGILESPRQGGDCLADFIVRTRDKELRHCDLSTVLSDRAERLLSLRT